MSTIKDTISAVNCTVDKINSGVGGLNSLTNSWLWIAIIELLIIYLLFRRKKIKKNNVRQQLKRESEGKIDFDNIINSSFHVKSLYDKLKVECHPDRFPIDLEKNKIALEIFQEIAKNKLNIDIKL